MNKILSNILSRRSFHLFWILTAFLFLFRIVFIPSENFAIITISEIVLALILLSLAFSLSGLFKEVKPNPLSLVVNVGILSAVIFLVMNFSEPIVQLLIGNVKEKVKNPGLAENVISILYSLIFLGFAAYVFLVFKTLFYFKQTRNVETYFNTMLIFFVLTSIAVYFEQNEELSYISTTFYIVSVLLIIFNSLRISWIAFIVKKEKIYLLILSVVILILFIVNLVKMGGGHFHYQIISSVSLVLDRFLNVLLIYGAIYFSILFFTTLFHIPTAEAFDKKAQEVSSLQYFSKLINEVLDFKDLSKTISDITTKLTGSDAAWIMWKNEDDFTSIAQQNIGYYDAQLIHGFMLSQKKWDKLDQAKIIPIEKFEKQNELSEKYSTLLVAPLKAHGNIKGFLLAAKKGNSIFNEEDRSALDTFSEYASIAFENARLLEESIEKQRLERELDVAREVQRRILPSKNPNYPNLDISSIFIPAFEVGGDYYDFFPIDQNTLGFIIADVSGKGISAAFIMAEVKGIFESLSKVIRRPKEILIKANEILKGTLERKIFVSAAYGLIDVRNGTLHIARAGHCPILLIREGKLQDIRPEGLGLGLSFDNVFSDSLQEQKVDLQENDTLILYTDGITEAKNGLFEDFGEDNFRNLLLKFSSHNVQTITEKVIKEVSIFSQEHSQYDDITLVIIRWKQNIINNGEAEWQISAQQLKT
ncbi:MAG: SpoIIE family protein phosphatase [Ignavibacteriaceae bacterium]|nr:SpoIIE family protein phosphatase [Ignavibacteriaceae bacterium]